MAPPSAALATATAALVLLGDLVNDRQAKAAALPRAGVGAAVEAIEDVRQVGLGDAVTVVAHGDPA